VSASIRVRPGRPADLPALLALWQADVIDGRRDSVPGELTLQGLSRRFDWDSKSRVAEGEGGRLRGAVLVTRRATPGGVMASMDVTGEDDVAFDLTGWALRFSRAAGAFVAQLFVGHGHGNGLPALGFVSARPWWRMDRTLEGTLPEAVPIAGYELLDGRRVKPGSWVEMHNRSFADHWRFAPRSEEELMSGKNPELCLTAVTSVEHLPAAITICHVERYAGDPRPHPVGLISSVGTVPDHRRRGLANWLVAAGLGRLRGVGARHASLYVDGWNETHAHEAYAKLGFRLAFEAEVWEASLS
jgi:ribosomal protein S18 acetylase RimI-like enzyme